MGWKQWTRERLTAADLQSYLQNQVVMRFSSASQRGTQLAAPAEGMLSTLDDTDAVERHDGTTWRPLGISCYGKMWRTSGPSAGLGAGITTVGMDAARVAGGVTFDASGDTLTVPLAGLYRVNLRGYMLGGTTDGWNASFIAQRVRASAADLTLMHTGMTKKSAAEDMCPAAQEAFPLAAGDKLRAQFQVGTGTGFYTGVNESLSVTLSAEYVGPLNGSAPL